MLICDTSGLIAYFDLHEPQHASVSAVIGSDRGPFAVSPYVLAEMDYLLSTRYGVRFEAAALRELAGSAWELPPFGASDLRQACDLIERYGDQAIGLADASLAVLAHRYRTERILTLDHRHFRVVRSLSGKPFTLLPDHLD